MLSSKDTDFKSKYASGLSLPVTNEEACQWEIKEISSEGTFTTNHSHDDPEDIRCNFTLGGEGSTGHVVKHTEEARRKMGRSGELNPRYGKKHSAESIQKMRDSHKGQLRSEEAKFKTSEACKTWHQQNPDFHAFRSCITSGEGNPRSKLTWEQVREIRSKYVPRLYSKPKLALEYGVSESVIGKIIAGISWKEETMVRDKATTYEGVIVGHYEGNRGTKREGMWGGFQVLMPNGVVTKCGGGFNDKQRAEIGIDPDSWIGRIVELEGQPDPLTPDGLTADGRIRFPVFIRERDPRDVDQKVLEAYMTWKKGH
jgi:NUMOD3 motif